MAGAQELDMSQFMPVEEIRPGMKGIGLSVFQGTTRDTFEVEILGVLENVGPGRDLILGRAHSELLEKTGIVSGMSGSPVYVDGRLIGAAAYAWSFAIEPVVGITPIGEMLGMLERSGDCPELGLDGISQENFRFALGGGAERALVSEIHPIQTPVALTGFTGSSRRTWQSCLSTYGFLGVEGGGRSPGAAPTALRPGDAMGIQMVRGDMTSTAIGTVTWVDGDRILGFGHPFLLAGPVSLPLSTAYIHAVLPSQVSSFKIGGPGKPVGAIRQDRQTGVMGVLGTNVSMLPVSVSVTPGRDGDTDQYHVEVMRSDILTASLIGLVGYSSVEASQKAIGESTLGIRTTIRIGPDRTLESEITVAVPSPPMAVAEQISRPIQKIIANPFEKVRIEGVDVHVHLLDRYRVAEVEDLRVDRAEVKPGEDLEVRVTLRPYREPKVVEATTVHIPADTPAGPLDLVACASGDLWEMEWERAPLRFEPADLDQLIDLLGSRRDTRRVYLQLFQHRSGRVVGGRELPRLPGSVLSVLDTGTRAGKIGLSAGAVVAESDIRTDWVVTGCRSITIQIVPR